MLLSVSFLGDPLGDKDDQQDKTSPSEGQESYA